MKCPFCPAKEIRMEPGVMLLESGESMILVHEECYQMSGEDGDVVRAIHMFDKLFGEDDGQDFLGFDRIKA